MELIKEIFLYSSEKPLLFTRLYFWIFFAVLLLFYSFLYKKYYLRNLYLFLASLFFYYKSGGYFFTLLIFSTVSDYFLGILIHHSSKKSIRKLFLSLSILINLGMLSYFKYAYFFTDLFNTAFDTNHEVHNLLAGWTNSLVGSSFDISKIILPVGISFFTFQTISYTIDVYRKKVEPVRNIINFGFYVSFFPQLVAGPIVRAAEFVPQLYKKYSLSMKEFGHALFLILSGLIKKMIVSDYLSVNFIDRIFAAPGAYTGFENLMGIYGYSMQIYCDFSGYTDIAIGVALLLGFRLPINFNSPYKAKNITDFWRRWHISLSSWLKDYLYIPLGGNRQGIIRTYINIMITMLLGGLWHGANLKFVLWGGLHGTGLVIHKTWKAAIGKIFRFRKKSSQFVKTVSIIITFHFVSFAWIFFRSESYEKARIMIRQIFNNFQIDLIPLIAFSYVKVFTILLIALVIHWLPSSFKENYRGVFIKSPIWVKVLVTAIVILLIYQFKTAELQPFIYFQF